MVDSSPRKSASASAPLPWTIADCLSATGGTLHGADPGVRFERIGIDSRIIKPHDLFVAIRGESHDGHRFADEVVARGVRGLMLQKDQLAGLPLEEWLRREVAVVTVDDTIGALGDLARFHRRRNSAAVAAITGSNGKTTTRQMTAAVLGQRFAVLSNRKNFNNNIGVPLTLFELAPDHRWAVVELGMNAPGEIRELAGICLPNLGAITNVGPAHLEGVGSIEGVQRAKGELLEKLPADGTAILNADDRRVAALAATAPCEVLFYGRSAAASVRAEQIDLTASGCRFDLVLPDSRTAVQLHVAGMFNVVNALAAAALGWKAGVPPESIRRGLKHFTPAAGRIQILETRKGIRIIDDTYNANPASMEAALQTLQRVRGDARGFFVMGDMLELGPQSAALHESVGAMAARTQVAGLLAAGRFASQAAAGARKGGMPPDAVFTGSREEILEHLQTRLEPGDWVLVKGSRGMAMERVVVGLKFWADDMP